MIVVLRDDDINYYTEVARLKNFYSEIKFVKPSFSIIPQYTPNNYDLFSRKLPKISRKVYENKKLINYIKDKGTIIHGIHHKNTPLPEFTITNTKQNILKIISDFKKQGLHANWFAPPCNRLNKANYCILKDLKLNISGVFYHKYSRLNSLFYIKPNFDRLLNGRFLDPVMVNGSLELPYWSIGPNANINALYNYIDLINQSQEDKIIQIAIHSWELYEYNIKEKHLLYDIMDYLHQDVGAKFIKINNLI